MLNQVEAGEEVIIARHGRPLAWPVAVVRIHLRTQRVPGGWKGQVWMAEDLDDADDRTLGDWYEGAAAHQVD
jgi:antitoxin (DNA-binding transcriptional repressor) of toxin-antitoxin stability system